MQQYLQQGQLQQCKTSETDRKSMSPELKQKENQKQQQQQEQSNPTNNSTIAYKLFIYRRELRNPQGGNLKLSKSKLKLSEELVSYSVDHIMEYGMDELVNINRQISFNRKLKDYMDKMHQMQKLQAQQNLSPQKMRMRTSG